MELQKIVIIGPESTGKSTLSQQLASVLGCSFNPEYAREYLEELGRPYEAADLLNIAIGQLKQEDELTKQSKGYLVCDTDLYVIKVWAESKYGYCDRHILEWIAARQYDLYLLTYPDMPWEDDPLREHPEPADRLYFYHQYRDIVIHSSVPWVEVRGDEAQRLDTAVRAIKKLS